MEGGVGFARFSRLLLKAASDRLHLVDNSLKLIYFNDTAQTINKQIIGIQINHGDNILSLLPENTQQTAINAVNRAQGEEAVSSQAAILFRRRRMVRNAVFTCL